MCGIQMQSIQEVRNGNLSVSLVGGGAQIEIDIFWYRFLIDGSLAWAMKFNARLLTDVRYESFGQRFVTEEMLTTLNCIL